jgi:hypothetical protein
VGKQIHRFRADLVVGTAVLACAAAVSAAVPASAAQNPHTRASVRSVGSVPDSAVPGMVVNNLNKRCLEGRLPGSGGVTVQPCNTSDPNEFWTIPTTDPPGFPVHISNNFNHECLEGRLPGFGGVTLQPCSSDPNEFWVTSTSFSGEIQNTLNGQCLEGRLPGSGGVTLQPCNASDPNEVWVDG